MILIPVCTRYPQKSRVYTAKYTTGHEDGATCDIAIETGPKAVLDAEIEMLKAVFDKTSMTLPSVLKVDHTGDLIPESYIILDYQIGILPFRFIPHKTNQS